MLGKVFNKSFVKIVDLLKTRGGVIVPAFTFAFAAELVLDETDVRKELQRLVEPVSDMLVPIFFITVSAKTNLCVLNLIDPRNREGSIIAVFPILVAILGKVLAGYIFFN